ncbi:MAG: hypothetical protein L6R35_003395 [Caloplaca aegaea]|nr:MAG: hypothetical protein L6R35_003395 [Caloplaca aegaea]
MPPFRNPFGRKPPTVNGTTAPHDENTPPPTLNGEAASNKPSYSSSRASSSLSIKKTNEPTEYKLSVVNDSGVYLPPSPPEKKSFWSPSRTSSTLSNHRSLLNENEPFSISRESFESYRRSFDISARSPVPPESTTPRQSLDSRMTGPTRSSIKDLERPQPTSEEAFEDVGLDDEAKHQPPKKRGIFARFGDNADAANPGDAPRPSSSHRGFHLPGRKRGQSGQGAELGNIIRPPAPVAKEPEDDGVIR